MLEQTMIEHIRKRRAELIATKMRHIGKAQQYQPGDEEYDPDFPSFEDDDDFSYYCRLQGHIEELHHVMELVGREVIT